MCGYLPVNPRIDPDDRASGAVRRDGVDRVVDLPVVAFAGLVDHDQAPHGAGAGRVVGRDGRAEAKAEQYCRCGGLGRRMDAI